MEHNDLIATSLIKTHGTLKYKSKLSKVLEEYTQVRVGFCSISL